MNTVLASHFSCFESAAFFSFISHNASHSSTADAFSAKASRLILQQNYVVKGQIGVVCSK